MAAVAVPSGEVDVVVWARSLGVGSRDEVWEHVIRSSADGARVLDALGDLLRRVADYPDEEIRSDLFRAFNLISDAGHELLRVARATQSD